MLRGRRVGVGGSRAAGTAADFGVERRLGGILGASFAPSLAQIVEAKGGVTWVGYYMAVAGLISFLAVFSMRETLDRQPESPGVGSDQ
jgi:hypothetical protein